MTRAAEPPEKSRRFRVIRRIGRGGQGTVYEANDTLLGRVVAIKVVHADGVTCGGSREEFPREAKMAARLQHPNIIPIYDVGEYNGQPFLVFEFVQGRTFKEMVKSDGAMAPRRALALFRPVLEGMAHAHERGVLHLDLTPGNVLVGVRDVPRIMDFGLSQLMNTVRDTTMMPVGTLLYMAPEQFEERPPGPHTDVRSLGLILFELLTGRTAITARTLAAAAHEITGRDIDLSPVVSSSEMAPVAEFLEGAVHRDPDLRYPSATAMLVAFDVAMEARREAQESVAEAPSRSTVDFLLRRMKRREDFPALSQSLVEINRLTASDSNATANQLSNVVLRDFALTNKLLKLANSSYYGSMAGEVKSVSHAISLIGFEQLRLTANSVTLFSHISDRAQSAALQDLLIRSFVAGLLARHLAQRHKLRNAEEAFICGMFQTLGEILTRFYFGEEHVDIEALVESEGLSPAAASRRVLGIDYATLGAAVAREWHFPDDIVDAIAGLADDAPVPEPADASQRLRDAAVMADGICRILGEAPQDDPGAAFEALRERFVASIPLDALELIEVARAAFQKLLQFAPILGIQTRDSSWCACAGRCIERVAFEAEAVADEGARASA